MADSVNLRNLKKKYPDSVFEERASFIIDKKLFGSLVVVGAIFGVKSVTVKDWIKEGLKYSEFKVGNVHLLNVKEAFEWYRDNKRSSFARNKSKSIEKPVVPPSQFEVDGMMNEANLENLTSCDQDYLDKLKTIEDIHLKRIKRSEAEGLLVNADDLDKAMSEQATIHYSDIANDEKVLPTLLANKTAEEVSDIYREHKLERKKMIEKIVNKVFKGSSTLYDIVEASMQKLADGVEPADIIYGIQKAGA